MNLRNDTELATTRRKLSILEQRVKILCNDADVDPEVKELTLQSLMSLVNQFKEEIVRYEASRAERKAG